MSEIKPWYQRRNDGELDWYQYDDKGNYINYSGETKTQELERYKRYRTRRNGVTQSLIALLDLIDRRK